MAKTSEGGGEKGEKGQGYLQHHALGTIYP